MSSLDSNFAEVMTRIRHGRELNYASFEPVYYLIFAPQEILQAKQMLPAWTARLKNDGWAVHHFSMAAEVGQILADAPQRKIWLMGDRKSPLEWQKTNKSLANTITQGQLSQRLENLLISAEEDPKAIVLITDLEALHPYIRIGSIESSLAGKFHVPTIIFYPGTRTGKTRLKFLGFYPEDGNYRSVHVGG